MLSSSGSRSAFFFATVLAISLSVVLACSCRFQKPHVTYCLAHWTAHAVIEDVIVNASIPGFEHSNNSDIQYKVKYLEIFKTPEELNGTLPTDVYTPTEEAACGLILEKGGEYLLSGRFVNDTSLSMLCGQIVYNMTRGDDILEWREVPKSIVTSLKTHRYDAKCK